MAHACAVSSGTSGLHLALRAAGVSDGDEVVTSPFSFPASANAPLFERARPVFADIDPRTLNLDPAAAAAAVTERTTALLPVHIFGYPADLPAFERMGLPIVEDACEALGAVHADGTPVGGRGHPSVFGFYANKQLTTGEGGMVTTADAAVKAQIDSERNQGRAANMEWLDFDRLGFNYRLSDIACAIGLVQLDRLDDMLAGRARAAALYREALAGIEGLELPCEDRRRRPARLVRLRRPAAARRRPRRDDPRAARARRPVQALPAGDPPLRLLPREVRPPRGRVPGLRGRRRALGGAAVLPAAQRGAGRARRGCAARGARALARAASCREASTHLGHSPRRGSPTDRRCDARRPPRLSDAAARDRNWPRDARHAARPVSRAGGRPR